MFKIKLLSVGKNKENWLEEAISIYTTRLKSSCSFEELYVKSNEELIKQASKETSIICLDPNGLAYDSLGFASIFFKELEKGGSRLTFIIGGAEGIPQEILKNAKLSLSLSKLTFTHQMARLIVIEQIYRAFEINKGSTYHK